MFGQDFSHFSSQVQEKSFRLLDEFHSSKFDTYNNLKQQLLYHQYLSKVYEEQLNKFLISKEYDTQIIINCPVISFNECIEHCYLKHQHLYKCINCGQNKELKATNIKLPDEILTKIFRFDRDLYYLSRMTSKTIRNLSFNDILQHEIIKPINYPSFSYENNLPHSLIAKYFYVDPIQGEIDYYLHMYVYPCGNLLTERNMTLYWHEYSSQNYKTRKTHVNKCEFKKLPYMSNHRDYDETLDVDFFSYYRIMVERLSLYQCDQKALAKQLTIDKLNKCKTGRKSYMMYLCSTAYLLNITIPPFDNDLNYENLITRLEPIVEDDIITS